MRNPMAELTLAVGYATSVWKVSEPVAKERDLCGLLSEFMETDVQIRPSRTLLCPVCTTFADQNYGFVVFSVNFNIAIME
jgi:hypothetical protein